MYAGTNREKARAQAQANANKTGRPWYLWHWGGAYRIVGVRPIYSFDPSPIEEVLPDK